MRTDVGTGALARAWADRTLSGIQPLDASGLQIAGIAVDESAPDLTIDGLVEGTAPLHDVPGPKQVFASAATPAPASVEGGVTSTMAGGSFTNSVDTTGDSALNAPTARASYHVSGAGIKIGIISDSFDAGGGTVSQLGTTLPAGVTVLGADYAGGTDEGRAMAELLHQVAPDAQLYFSTGFNTQQVFADSILALAAAGCRVIVDDVGYFAEPFFQDGNIIQNAIETVVAEGVSYFTAAGNQSTQYYELSVSLSSTTVAGLAGEYEDFGTTSGSGSDFLQRLTFSANAPVSIDLQWTQPFLTDGAGHVIGAGSSYTLTLELFDLAGNMVASSVAGQDPADPVQLLQYRNPNGSSTDYNLAIVETGAMPVGNTLKYIVFGQATIDDSAAGQGTGSVFGQALIVGANTVGAANATTPGRPNRSLRPVPA